MARKLIEFVDNISFGQIKASDIVQIYDKDTDSLKEYMVIKRGQEYLLYPINLELSIKVNMYDIHQPMIVRIFDGKSGYCRIQRKTIKEVKGDE